MPPPSPNSPTTPTLLRLLQHAQLTLFVLFPSLWLSSSATRHVDRKAGLLWAWGALCTIALLLQLPRLRYIKRQHVLAALLLTLFLLQLGFATAFSMDPRNSLFAGEAYRVGTFSTLAFVAIGLSMRPFATQLLPLLYLQAVLLAGSALLLDISTWPYGYRLRGATFQPNILAAHLALGFLLGLCIPLAQNSLTRHIHGWPKRLLSLPRPLFWGCQILLFIALWLTQSRGAIVLLALFSIHPLLALYKRNKPQHPIRPNRLLNGLIIAAFCGLLLSLWLGPKHAAKRLSPSGRWLHAIHYRLALQQHGVIMLPKMFWHGWGPDSIIFAFGGLHPLPPILQKSFRKGVRFDSTHNWYLDKFLELGWLGGTATLALLLLALHRGRTHHPNPTFPIYTALLLMLATRYLWSVSMMEIELLYWSILLTLLFPKTPMTRGRKSDSHSQRSFV